jgi:hypothetical protein
MAGRARGIASALSAATTIVVFLDVVSHHSETAEFG